jgi:lysophospholipase L1-like esterase
MRQSVFAAKLLESILCCPELQAYDALARELMISLDTSTWARRLLGEQPVSRTGLGIMVVVGIGATAACLNRSGRADIADNHRDARQLILRYTLSRSESPVIVLGDSIVEASTLPRSICGHAIVNAGLNGATTESDLGSWLSQALGSKRAGMIVVALGTNDALRDVAASKQRFATRYDALLAQLSKLTSKLAVLEIPPVETKGRMTVVMRNEAMTTINNYNAILPEVANQSSATFVALPVMLKSSTIDGVHLSSDGYEAWDRSVTGAAAQICS